MSEKDKTLSWADMAKKLVYTGLGSAAMATQAVSDTNLRKELIQVLLSVAEKRKDEMMQLLAREMTKFLGRVNVSEELTKALKGLSLHVDATLSFEEKSKKTAPHVRFQNLKVTRK